MQGLRVQLKAHLLLFAPLRGSTALAQASSFNITHHRRQSLDTLVTSDLVRSHRITMSTLGHDDSRPASSQTLHRRRAMTNSHGYVLEYPRIRVDHFDQAPVPLPASLLAHRRSVVGRAPSTLDNTARACNSSPHRRTDKPLLYLLTHTHGPPQRTRQTRHHRPHLLQCNHETAAARYERQKTRIEKDRDAQAGKPSAWFGPTPTFA